MDYEELYGNLQNKEKNLKDKILAAQKLYKAIAKDTEGGDVKSLVKNLAALEDVVAGQAQIRQELAEIVNGFDTKEYFESGDFAGQLLECCRTQGIDVQGEYPVFEMFPYRVRIDEENQDIYLDRKRVQCVRPTSVVQMVKQGQDRMMRASFNAQGFANELATF